MNQLALVATFLVLLWLSLAGAQQPPKTASAGWLDVSADVDVLPLNEFKQGLHDLGYIEGKSIIVESTLGGWKI